MTFGLFHNILYFSRNPAKLCPSPARLGRAWQSWAESWGVLHDSGQSCRNWGGDWKVLYKSCSVHFLRLQKFVICFFDIEFVVSFTMYILMGTWLKADLHNNVATFAVILCPRLSFTLVEPALLSLTLIKLLFIWVATSLNLPILNTSMSSSVCFQLLKTNQIKYYCPIHHCQPWLQHWCWMWWNLQGAIQPLSIQCCM